MKILLGIKDISGVAWRMRCGLREVGVCADMCNLYPFRHADVLPTDYPMPRLMAISHRITHAIHIRNIGGVRLFFLSRMFLVVKLLIFFKAIIRYDCIVYFGGVSMFDQCNILDKCHYVILKLLKKRVVVFYFGSDARPDYMDGVLCDLKESCLNVARKKQKMRMVERYATHIVMPSSCTQLSQREIINLIAFNLPHPTAEEAPTEELGERTGGEQIVVLHAPSEPSIKGTAQIRAVVQDLRAEGLHFEYLEVSGMPRRKVLAMLQASDFVIDQMYSDVPFASFVTEAAYFGKPAVVGGYYAELITADVPEEHMPPSLYVTPDNMKDAIRRMIVDHEFRRHLSKRARDHAVSKSSPREVAGRLLNVLNGRAVASLRFDPSRCLYFGGLGMELERLRRVMKVYIDKNGEEALMVSEKPGLRRTMLTFANESSSPSVQ